ncbi:hypothetical protein TRV_05353 [Trichophyton verrucosum HKI 0517]|uniref:Uncharacterized protein n=1 Tax=Trichophyton verrucosum (strain HKI 0517) TaxID=663202 RepID=D4DDY9_TRIVH|nr:uncharacterized protein TRV_05353 [Trichophyton verrucosum HKI 0517]EFE39936.1 hypothetical protein TRV_05353 [Trichophyton verrucosum HKI 0517]
MLSLRKHNPIHLPLSLSLSVAFSSLMQPCFSFPWSFGFSFLQNTLHKKQIRVAKRTKAKKKKEGQEEIEGGEGEAQQEIISWCLDGPRGRNGRTDQTRRRDEMRRDETRDGERE